MTFLKFSPRRPPREQGQNVWGASAAVARLDRTSLACGRAVDDHRIEFSVRSIEATAAVDRARRAQLIELAVCGRCPAKLSFLPAVTGHTWRENAPKVLKNGGGGYCQDPEGLVTSFWFWGGGQTITWFFIFFPYLFYQGFFLGDCSKFCVKKKWNPLPYGVDRGKLLRAHAALLGNVGQARCLQVDTPAGWERPKHQSRSISTVTAVWRQRDHDQWSWSISSISSIWKWLPTNGAAMAVLGCGGRVSDHFAFPSCTVCCNLKS